MILTVEKVCPKEWEKCSEDAHRAVFGEIKPKEWDRIDFALVCLHGNILLGYVTCREHDHETLYWQYGGSFPTARNKQVSWYGYKAFMEWCSTTYKRVVTVIENTNIAMLKMAMKVGFVIVGVRTHQGSVLLELVREF